MHAPKGTTNKLKKISLAKYKTTLGFEHFYIPFKKKFHHNFSFKVNDQFLHMTCLHLLFHFHIT